MLRPPLRLVLILAAVATLPFGWVLAQAQSSRPRPTVAANGTRAYVAMESSGTVAVIDTATNSVETIICLGSDLRTTGPVLAGPCNYEGQHHSPLYNGHAGTHGLWLTPDGRVLLATNRLSSTVVAIDTSQLGANPGPAPVPVVPANHTNFSELVPGYEPTGREPHLATVRPGGREAWVAVRGENYIDVLDLDYGRLFDEDRLRTDRLRPRQSVGPSRRPVGPLEGPSMVSFTSDGKSAFIAMAKESLVYKVQADSGQIQTVAPVPHPFSPFGLVTPDDKELYVVHKLAGQLSILRTDDLSPVVPPLTVGPCANH